MEVTMMEGMLSFHFDIRDTRVHQGASDIEISQALVCADANKEKHNVWTSVPLIADFFIDFIFAALIVNELVCMHGIRANIARVANSV